ncbi:MAG: acyltransferase family protein [Lachnospiraceae bacterium]
MNSKKAIMGLAALLILIFHFYIPVNGNVVEMFISKTAYIGVDIFFLVSAVSLSKREIISYGSFMKNRFLAVYVPFLFFSVICAWYRQWPLAAFLKTISGISFFERGGGSFLWFLYAIMLFYLAAPGMLYLKRHLGWRAFALLLLIWAGAAAVFQYGFGYQQIFILWNRLPVFLLGLYYDKIVGLLTKRVERKWILLPVLTLFLSMGMLLLYQFGMNIRLQTPFADMYYIMAIPMVIAIAGFFELGYQRTNMRLRVLEWIGKFSLEIYGLQMVFGYDLESRLLKIFKNGLAAFAGTIVVLTLSAFLLQWIKRKGGQIIVSFKNGKSGQN